MTAKQRIDLALAQFNFKDFVQQICEGVEMTPFHCQYYDVLDRFAKGEIRKLIVSVPPQHGKSMGSSELLPAYLLGRDPSSSVAIASYSLTLARRFSQRVQRNIDNEIYPYIFPRTMIKGMFGASHDSYVRTKEEFEVIGHRGGLKAVGREGGLTGNKVDIMIIDDLYKDALEANSPLIRDNAWEWYTSVIKTRLHNDSRELIVFTRWHEDDLIGRLEQSEKVVELTSLDQIDDKECWYKLNFEAIKETEPTELDRRIKGEALWPNRHSRKSLDSKRKLDPMQFDAMYQGHPASKEGLLYGDNFKIYDITPGSSEVKKIANYTDSADTGEDYLCSICYLVGRDNKIYVTDVLYTSAPMEITEGATASMIQRNGTRTAYVESNNGGRGFARTLQRLCGSCRVDWFHQSGNKEARIHTNSATVLHNIIMPSDWKLRWAEFYRHTTTFKRIFAANRHDDAADTLTGIVEKELQKPQGNTTFHF